MQNLTNALLPSEHLGIILLGPFVDSVEQLEVLTGLLVYLGPSAAQTQHFFEFPMFDFVFIHHLDDLA